MQVIPALDLLGEHAVRLERGNFDKVLFREPIEDFMGRLAAERPPLIHVVDLEGARDGALRVEMLRRCHAAARGIPLQVSGGIRSLESAQSVLDAGAARVIVGTALWSEDDALARFSHALGDQLVAALDVRDGHLALRGWREASNLDVDAALERCREAGVVRLHVTAIERDGTMQGPDLALYRQACASGMAVVAAGGVRGDRDLEALAGLGCEGAVMGVGYLTRIGLTLPTFDNDAG